MNYIPAVSLLSEQYSLQAIAAAALCSAYGETKPVYQEGQDISNTQKNGMVRLFMTIGKKDRIKVADIVRSIASEAAIPRSRIGNIDVLNSFTFVEVPEDLADRVICAVDDMIMKGRRIRIKKAKAK